LAGLFLFVLLAAGPGAWWGWQVYTGPGPLAEQTTLVIARGAGVQGIANQLEQAGIVGDSAKVLAAAKLRGSVRRLKAGEYAFPAAVSLRGVMDILESGQTVVRRITVPEGLTSAQIVGLLLADPALSGEVPTVPPDGTLLPETYHYSHGDDRQQLLGRMQAAMQEALRDLWPARDPSLPYTQAAEAVTMASIIEKETGQADERAMVAGVFINRLRQGMRLQSDPTVIYALTGGRGTLDRELTRADWRFESPFNTYVSDGLPPGPIANPGRESLRAALNPAEHDYLYFVADGTGGHAFARTLAEHNRNVAAWRRFRSGG